MSAYIHLKDVFYQPSLDVCILRHINLTFGPGRITTIIGPNGAGKTTLLRLILGLLEPSSGTITRYQDINIAYVPQKIDINPLIPMRVKRLMALSQSARIPEEHIEEALHVMGVCHLKDRLFMELSGGERQRVLVARALLRRPQLLVMDEPTQAMDVNAQAEFFHFLARYKTSQNVCIVMVSHDLHAVMSGSDQVICLNQHICCQGAPEDVAQNAHYQQFFGFAPYVHHHDHVHTLECHHGNDHGHHHG